MSEYFNYYERGSFKIRSWFLRYFAVPRIINTILRHRPQYYFPVLDYTVIKTLQKVPIYYRRRGYIQKQIISVNTNELLKYRFTGFDMPREAIPQFAYLIQLSNMK